MVAPQRFADGPPRSSSAGRPPWWSDGGGVADSASPLAKEPASLLGLFRMVLAIRWLALVVLPIQVGVGTGSTPEYAEWAGVAVAVLYTLLLTVFAKRILAAHLSGPLFSVGDMGVVAALFATGHGSSWPFFLFGTTTIMLSGLRGSVRLGVAAALAWNALMILITLVRGEPISHVLGIQAIEDIFNLSMIAAIWAYCVRVALQLQRAYADLAENADALARTHRVLDDRERSILSLMSVGAAMLDKREVGDVLQVMIDALAGMGFGRCRVWLLNQDRLELISGDEGIPAISADSDEPLACAVRERTIRTREPDAPGHFPGVDPRVLAIVVPILTKDEALGAMVVESVSGEPYTQDDRELLEMLAGQIALAMQHVRFGQQGQELAIAEERSRITHEIHDSVVQKIYGASLLAGSLRSGEFSPRVAKQLRLLEETALMALNDLRFAVLQWDSLAWRGSPAEFTERYVEEFAVLSGIPTTFTVSGDGCRLGPSRAKDLLVILHESLSNIRSHANAGAVRVEMELAEDGVDLTITDDGRGYDPDQVVGRPAEGVGRMAARSKRNGGMLRVTSSPGQGTAVHVWIPCQGGA